MNLQTARSLIKSGRKAVTGVKPVSELMEYIKDIQVLMEKGAALKCEATSQAFFESEDNLLEILKWNALLRIGKSL